MSDTKKDVCRTLTNVVRNSTLADRIDPKSFYVMLNTNFSVLCSDGVLDLGPVWDALASGEAPPALYGLFLSFEQAAYVKGFSVRLPAHVAGLSTEQRATYTNLSHPVSGGAAPPSIVEVSDEEFYQTDPNAAAIPLSLDTGDLRPFLPDDLKRDVVQIVVQSLKEAPVGQRLDAAQLAYLVDSNFADLCDGQNFDFGPILGGLRQLEGVNDTDVYAGVVALEIALADRGLTLQPIEMDVDQEIAASLLEQAEQAAKARAEQAALEAHARSVSQKKPAPPPPVASEPVVPPKGGDKREQRLKRWGLRVLDDRKVKALRYGILAVGLLVVLAVGYMMRPNREIGLEAFAGTLPMKSAQLQDGVFYGVVDDAKWWPLSIPERKKRIAAIEALMRAKGWVPNSQIRDTKGRLALVGLGGGKIRAAASFRLGDKDGNIPKELLDAEKNESPEAKAAASRVKSKGGGK